MKLTDGSDLRQFIELILPGVVIDEVAAPSGQRVVYFCHFVEGAPVSDWINWGQIVLKISEGRSAQAIAYVQREIDILNRMNNDGYPKLLHHEVVTEDPITEERLQFRRFVTIEEKINSQPLNQVRSQFSTETSVVELLTKLVVILRPLWEWKPPLVHRDLKPQNILITPENDVVVIDLGLIREEGADGVTMTEAPWGPCTPCYASPEQATNDKRNITFRSDFFSLGTLCYELLSGANPFVDGCELVDQILEKVVKHTPESLFSRGLSSEKFSRIVEKMMEKQPYRRFRRIDDLLQELSEVN